MGGWLGCQCKNEVWDVNFKVKCANSLTWNEALRPLAAFVTSFQGDSKALLVKMRVSNSLRSTGCPGAWTRSTSCWNNVGPVYSTLSLSGYLGSILTSTRLLDPDLVTNFCWNDLEKFSGSMRWGRVIQFYFANKLFITRMSFCSGDSRKCFSAGWRKC